MARLLKDERRKNTISDAESLDKYDKAVLVLMCTDRDLDIFICDKRCNMKKADLIDQLVQHQSDLPEFEAPDQCDNPSKRQRLSK
jgi:hypothetical protein